ncbi:hypothetical protein BU15DRAFT_79514 [Melanogaster broomeanus]|nr:hypothetical protein BU15DRAFT_79514 [Melanogaster broomeanus]
MKAEAQEALGMVKPTPTLLFSPVITTFRLPLTLIALIYCTLGAIYVAAVTLLPASTADAMIFGPLRCVTHTRKHLYVVSVQTLRQGAFVTAIYVAATFVAGNAIWYDLRKRVQEKRIESMMKAE